MPKCKNDPKRYYTGDEPSPKGLGFCAHAEAVGKTRKGRDGKHWIVDTTKKGTKRWSRLPGEPIGKAVVVEEKGKKFLVGPAVKV